MASNVVRRPLPALVALIALLALTGIVWWRVLHRDSGASAATSPCPSTSATAPARAKVLPPPRTVDVLVLNATSRTGIAAKTRKTLVHDGFKSPQKAANDLSNRKVTGVGEIRFGPAGKSGAMTLSFYVPGATLVPTKGSGTTVTISLGPTYKKVASAATVRQALAADHTHLAASAPSPTPSPSSSCAS